MSEADRELIERVYGAWNEQMPVEEFVAEFFTEDGEWHDQPELPDATVHVGKEALATNANALITSFGHFHCDVKEVLDAGGEWVVVFDLRGKATLGDAPVELLVAHVVRLRDGRIERLRAFLSKEQALTAVGASP